MKKQVDLTTCFLDRNDKFESVDTVNPKEGKTSEQPPCLSAR